MKLSRRAAFFGLEALSALALVGCATDSDPIPPVPLDGGIADVAQDAGSPDAGGGLDAAPGPDRPPPEPNGRVTVSGSVLRLEDYLRGDRLPLSVATITPVGLNGVVAVNPNAQGAYSISVPQNGRVVFSVTKNNHTTTYEDVPIADAPITKDFLLATKIWVDLLASTNVVDVANPFPCHAPNPTAESCRFALVVGRLLDDGTDGAGTPAPIAGVTKNEFTISVDGSATWYRKGPYFLTADGTPQPGLTVSTRDRDPDTNAYRGGLFAVFVEIPVNGPSSRSVEISVQTAGVTGRKLGPTLGAAFRDGLVWVKLNQTAVGPPPVNPPPLGNVDFDTQVYPIFLPVNQGGYGCQGCHTDVGGAPAGGMNLTGGPTAAFGALDPQRYPNRVSIQNPSQSELLTKPLYDLTGVQDHPIFAFVSPQDPAYQTIYAWIQQGAGRLGGGSVPPQPPVSFYQAVRPLLYQPAANGGLGCVDCHSGANPAAGFSVDGNANSLFLELTGEVATDQSGTGEAYRINKQGQVGQSLVLTNPTLGLAELHPVKLLSGTTDPRYQTIYAWISQGYTNDSP